MKKEDYYTIKQILLGLQPQYKKRKKQLEELEKLIIYNKEVIEDVTFTEYLDKNNNINLICNIKPKKSIPREILESILKKIGLYRYEINSRQVVLDETLMYTIKTQENEEEIKIIDKKEFTEQANNIIYSEEFKLRELKLYNYISVSKKGTLVIDKTGILYQNNKKNNRIIAYDANEDILIVRGLPKKKEKPNCEYINKVLKIRISKRRLSDYTIQQIEKSELTNKPLILVEELNKKLSRLNMVEMKEKIYLKKQ